MAFSVKNGKLVSEGVELFKLCDADTPTPFVVYSKAQLVDNVQRYKRALQDAQIGEKTILGCSLKANNNLSLLRLLEQQGCFAVTVSGFEVLTALEAGFGNRIFFNGNGKQLWEIELAIKNQCILNVDSLFDAQHIVQVASKYSQHHTKVLLRINPALQAITDIEHAYNITGVRQSKFGIELQLIDQVIETLQTGSVNVMGFHCHIGSTVTAVEVYSQITKLLLDLIKKYRAQGLSVNTINIGGGLGIPYHPNAKLPTPHDLIQAVVPYLLPDVKLVLEPGRSVFANTAALVTRVLGWKVAGEKKYVIVDAAMNDLIRPSLYNAYHHVIPLEVPENSSEEIYDIAGPVCESGDFLGKDRKLPLVSENMALAVLDVGAYGMAMASNYNMRPRAMEILIDGEQWRVIRRRETLDDLLRSMKDIG